MQSQQIVPICATTGKHELNEDSDGKYQCTFCGKAANGYGMMCYSCEMLFDPSEVKDMFDHFEVCINARGDEEFSLYKVVPTLRDRASHKS